METAKVSNRAGNIQEPFSQQDMTISFLAHPDWMQCISLKKECKRGGGFNKKNYVYVYIYI